MNAFDDSVGLRVLDRRRFWCELKKLRGKLGSVVTDSEFGTRTATEPLAIDDKRDVFTSLGGAGSKFDPASSGVDHRNGLDMAIDAIGVSMRPGTKEPDTVRTVRAITNQCWAYNQVLIIRSSK